MLLSLLRVGGFEFRDLIRGLLEGALHLVQCTLRGITV